MYVVDTNVFSYLIKLKGNHLLKDAERARKYAARRWADIITSGRRLGKVHVHEGQNPKREAQLNDTWIAACALAHGLTLVSDNSRDFEWMREAVGLDLVSYSGA
jgi:predicted nucleic acid-binding protein